MTNNDSQLQQSRNYQREILLVDDSQVNLMLTKKLLENLGIEVMTATNGQQAVDCTKDAHFHLIFMDLEMPIMGGIEASIVIREQQRSKAPIVALTSRDLNSVRAQCKEARMSGFLEKPVTAEKLVSLLDKFF